MRKICLLALVGLLMAGSWIGVYPSSVQAADPYVFTAGDGFADPFLVMTPEDMNHVRDYPTANYKLGADIDLSDYSTGGGWMPIGTSSDPFTGTFDGKQFLITNLFIDRTNSDYVGLFGYADNATLTNIRLMNVDVVGLNNVGGLIGFARSTKIIGSSVSSMSGSVKATASHAGGLVGYLVGFGAIIEHSYAAINVSGDHSGGLLGAMDLNTDGIVGSYASGDVTGSSIIGGLTATARSSVTNTYATGNVTATTSTAAGLVNFVSLLPGKEINSSFQTGLVTGGSSSSGILISSYNGDMTDTDLVYNTTHNPSLPAINTFTGGSTLTGYIGLLDADMKTSSAYGPSWDFSTSSVWGINEGVSYPYLRSFTPIVRVNALAQASYGLNSLLTVDGFMMDGSMGELVEVEYEIVNASHAPVASGFETLFSPTEDVQTYSFPETLDGTRFPEGVYTVNVKAEDDEGHQAPARSVTFTVDHTPPVITLNGANPLQVSVGSAYNEPEATALDAVDGILTPQIMISGSVNTNVVGSYTITYTVTDAAGNTATNTRTVNVVSAGSGGGSPSVQLSNNANLAKLTLWVGGVPQVLTPTYAPEVTDYRVETSGEQGELQLSAADPKAIVTVLDKAVADKISIPLVVGTQTIKITVRAEDGTLKVYSLTITRIVDQESVAPVSGVCPFTDIQGHWAQADICEAASLNIVEGVSANIFAPNTAVTRTEFAVMLLRTLQIEIVQQADGDSFGDMASIPEWARAAILTGQAKGIVNGYLDGTFRPQLDIVRAEMAVMLAKSLKWETGHELDLPFSDGTSIPAWAQSYVKTVYAKGLLQGRGKDQFVPNGFTTRAEAAVVMLRLWKSLDEFQQ